jgi:sphingolipid 4-desaturase/C4-monooxygenase
MRLVTTCASDREGKMFNLRDSHSINQPFSRPMANRIFGLFVNLPVGIPISISFKKYHAYHHRYQAIASLDPDLPTDFEAKLFCTTFGKVLWICLQPFWFAFRPLIVNPIPPTRLEILNFMLQVFVFNLGVLLWFGWKMIAYLIISTILSCGLHPIAGKRIEFNRSYSRRISKL